MQSSTANHNMVMNYKDLHLLKTAYQNICVDKDRRKENHASDASMCKVSRMVNTLTGEIPTELYDLFQIERIQEQVDKTKSLCNTHDRMSMEGENDSTGRRWLASNKYL